MSKAEEFIQENTRNCSQLHYNSACTLRHCITPEQAREAVKIAREETLNDICERIEENTLYSDTECAHFTKEDVIGRLKPLRRQCRWKPSEEQIEVLEYFVRSIGESGYASPYDNNTKLLYSLLSDLKKLKEEQFESQKGELV